MRLMARLVCRNFCGLVCTWGCRFDLRAVASIGSNRRSEMSVMDALPTVDTGKGDWDGETAVESVLLLLAAEDSLQGTGGDTGLAVVALAPTGAGGETVMTAEPLVKGIFDAPTGLWLRTDLAVGGPMVMVGMGRDGF